jgi:hypothetical protein
MELKAVLVLQADLAEWVPNLLLLQQYQDRQIGTINSPYIGAVILPVQQQPMLTPAMHNMDQAVVVVEVQLIRVILRSVEA